MELAAAVAPTTLARQRTLPVAEPLRPLLPDGALVRGRAVACRGGAATSLALALAAETVAAGSWVAVVDVPWLGVEAAAELGVPLERLVRIDLDGASSWAEVVLGVVDGFEVVVTRPPRRLAASAARRVQARVKARESVLLTVDQAGDGDALPVELTVAATASTWEGVERGWGCLRGRRVVVEAVGRRVPTPRRVEVWLPGPTGGVTAVDEAGVVDAPALRPVG